VNASLVKSRYLRRDQKFGIELPHTVKRSLEIDSEMNTTFWIDVIQKEMKTVTPAFEFLEKGTNAPVGYQKIPCHIIFDGFHSQSKVCCWWAQDGSSLFYNLCKCCI
jgi:hypothetical protein